NAVIARRPKADAAIQESPGALRSLDRHVASLLAMTIQNQLHLVLLGGVPCKPRSLSVLARSATAPTDARRPRQIEAEQIADRVDRPVGRPVARRLLEGVVALLRKDGRDPVAPGGLDR